MKTLLILLSNFLFLTAIAQSKTGTLDKSKKLMTVEASCGQCKFGLKGKSCDLAVRINGKSYFVDGANIDDFGDAHGKHGFCNAIRKAKVQGDTVNDRFKATYFQVLPKAKKS